MQVYSVIDGAWKSPGRTPITSPVAPTDPGFDRSSLVYGNFSYPVNDRRYVGVLTPDDLEPWGAAAEGQGRDLVATKNDQVFEGIDVFGSLNSSIYSNVTAVNCRFWGTQIRGVDTAAVFAQGSNYRGLRLVDCTLTQRPGVLHNEWCSAIKGGNITIERTEINNYPDGVIFSSALGNGTLLGSWIHDGWFNEWVIAEGSPVSGVRYYNGSTPTGPRPWPQGAFPYAPGSTLYTHSDAVQFAIGKNYTIQGNYIGGEHVKGDHNATPSQADLIRQGDSFYNSSIILKQEVDASAANKLENILITGNTLGGGQATFNFPSGRGNDFESTEIGYNRFLRSNTGQPYILVGKRSDGVTNLGNIHDNVYADTLQPIPISRGA